MTAAKSFMSKTETQTSQKERYSGCLELWAGHELTQQTVQFAGLEAAVTEVPSGNQEGGDLCALYSCGAGHARVVVADCIGHGFAASRVAVHVHRMLHNFRELRNSSELLAALNDEFTLHGQEEDGPLRLTTLVTATYDSNNGEFNFAYAAHPRMLLWRKSESRWFPIGEGLAGLPIGFLAGETYLEQSIRMLDGDIVLLFSDGVTDVFSCEDEQLGPDGFLKLTEATMSEMVQPVALDDLVQALVEKIRQFHGARELNDDLTLLALRKRR
jgi:phosphoserine phosphatase RsbU/P